MDSHRLLGVSLNLSEVSLSATFLEETGEEIMLLSLLEEHCLISTRGASFTVLFLGVNVIEGSGSSEGCGATTVDEFDSPGKNAEFQYLEGVWKAYLR